MKDLLFALKHKKTQRHYLLVEDGLEGERVSVIDPEGAEHLMQANAFEEDYLDCTTESIEKNFPQVQREAFKIALKEKEKRDESEAAEQKRRANVMAKADERVNVQVLPSNDSRPQHKPQRRPQNSKNKTKKTGLREVSWESDRLTFYRHKIEPLAESGVMKLEVGARHFKLTKAQFERLFNDVLMSKDYQNLGYFTFAEIPERILEHEY